MIVLTFELPIEIETIILFLWKMPGVRGDEWTASMKQTPCSPQTALSKALRRVVVAAFRAEGFKLEDAGDRPF
jgi:hypothetical protein